jgi:hypothetical protein
VVDLARPQLPLKEVVIDVARPQLPLKDLARPQEPLKEEVLIDMSQPQLPLAEATPEDMIIAATMAAQRRATRIFVIDIGVAPGLVSRAVRLRRHCAGRRRCITRRSR